MLCVFETWGWAVNKKEEKGSVESNSTLQLQCIRRRWEHNMVPQCLSTVAKDTGPTALPQLD